MYKKISIVSFLSGVILLFFYSFTQVDLGLTLTRASIFTNIQKSFQYIGYFNRPLSSFLFIFIIIFLFTSYLSFLYFVKIKKIERKTVWTIIICVSIILGLSYNAFSYDFFNYIFDARIVTHYHENPYIHKALDYPGDPMLGFMHWTHRVYPYGPVWLGLTIPLSFVGAGYFLLTFFLFKALAILAFLVSCFYLEKIALKIKSSNPLFILAFFSLNPFVLIESLVSGHNDMVMMALALMGVYYLLIQKKYSSLIFLVLSVGIKFATAFLVPLFVWLYFSRRKDKESIFLMLACVFMTIALILASYRTTFQPWYLLLIFPFASLLSVRYYFFLPFSTFSLLVLLQYLPYLYTGNFDPPIPMILNQMLWVSLIFSTVLPVIYKIGKLRK